MAKIIATPQDIVKNQFEALASKAQEVGLLTEDEVKSLKVLIECQLLLDKIGVEIDTSMEEFSVEDLKKIVSGGSNA